MTKPISVQWHESLFTVSRMVALPLIALSCAAHAATLSISANPMSVTSGAPSTLTWSSSDATSCSASGAWSGVKATSGSQSVTVANGLSTYALNCSGPSGSASNAVVIGATANLMGIHIAAPLDYEEDRLYADVVRASRTFVAGNSENGTTLANVDSNGWPQSDFAFYLWGSLINRHGTYTLTFTGQATVTSNPGINIPITYDPPTNTSAGTFNYTNTGSGAFALRFAGTKRLSTDASGTGVTSIKLLQPLTPGSTTSYPPTTLFTNPIKALISKFRVIRFMDFLSTNSNQQKIWSERPLPAWASFNRYNNIQSPTSVNNYGWQGIGGPLEHAILLANETGRDAWINIPILADDNYVMNVAKMLAYGSDGVNPYSSAEAAPIYPPLNSNLKVYVEYSNEIWNSAGAFTQFHDNCQLASDELVAGNSPLNWDGIWNNVAYVRGGANSSWNYSMCWRRPAKRTVEISTIFRTVFGDAAMMTRVRPVMMTQLGSSGRSLFDETKMLFDYYNKMDSRYAGATVARPPSYYIYGAGGSGYYNVTSPITITTLDQLFTSPDMLPAGFAPELQADVKYTAAMGVKRVAYEGGPSFDRTNNSTIDGLYAQAVLDPRIKTAVVDMHNEWSAKDGDLLVYYRQTGDYQWGFTPNVYDLGTFKLAAIDTLNASSRAALTFGTLAPGAIAGSIADICSRGWGCNPIQSYDGFTADGSKIIWASYSFRSTASSLWSVNLSFTSASANASVAVYVDGTLIGTQNTAGGPLSFSAGTIGPGLHGVVVRAAAGAFSLNSVAVAQN